MIITSNKIEKQPPEVFFQKGVPEYFPILTKKIPLLEFLFDKLLPFKALIILTGKKYPPVLRKSMTMEISLVGTSNQLFKKGSYTDATFSKKINKLLANSVICDRSILYSPFYLS